jgi:hypothetical protein
MVMHINARSCNAATPWLPRVLDRQPIQLISVSVTPCSAPSAEAAAEALLHAAQRKWAVAYAGSFSDDITVAVAFLPA